MMRVSVAEIPPSLEVTGEILSVHGPTIHARLPYACIGDLCLIDGNRPPSIPAQVVGFDGCTFTLAPLRDAIGIHPGSIVRTRNAPLTVRVGERLLGRVVDALGIPIDGKGEIGGRIEHRSLHAPPPSATQRTHIEKVFSTGVRAIDTFCTLGLGQRIGVFASAGVGKSTLLGMITRNAEIDVVVVSLVGERGREVREFIDATLGPQGMRRSVVVVATSDQPSMLRQTAPACATTIAEYFRDAGKNVLLIVDSLTRMARAVRETTLAAGELPVRHGYTPSVYTELPKLVERAGTSTTGSITAIYTVLTNEEDDVDPLADEIKSLIDGHIMLKRELANRGVLPAIDVTQSLSRLFARLHSQDYRNVVQRVIRAYSRLFREKDLVLLGGLPDKELAHILSHEDTLLQFLCQNLEGHSAPASTRAELETLATLLRAMTND